MHMGEPADYGPGIMDLITGSRPRILADKPQLGVKRAVKLRG